MAALAAPSVVAAQREDVAPLVLRLPASARALAMGNVAVAGRDDDVVFYNPAQLAVARGMSVSAEQFSPTARAGALSTVTRFSTGGIAIGATAAQIDVPAGAYPLTRAALIGGGGVRASEASLVVGVAQVFKSTRIGGSAKFVNEQIGTARNSGAVFDLGLGRDFFRTSFGIAVQNLGESFTPTLVPGAGAFTVTHMPFRVTAGAARGWNTDALDISATAAVSTLRDGFVVPAGGVEVGYSWLDGYNILVRAGARRPEHGEGAATAGIGFTMDRLSIDYALETMSGSRAAHRIGLRVR